MSQEPTNLCAEVDEHLAELLDGSGPEPLYDHLADCDRCRDLRHDAERVGRLVRDAGADHVSPNDLGARLLAALDARGGVAARSEADTLPSERRSEALPESRREVAPPLEAVTQPITMFTQPIDRAATPTGTVRLADLLAAEAGRAELAPPVAAAEPVVAPAAPGPAHGAAVTVTERVLPVVASAPVTAPLPRAAAEASPVSAASPPSPARERERPRVVPAPVPTRRAQPTVLGVPRRAALGVAALALGLAAGAALVVRKHSSYDSSDARAWSATVAHVTRAGGGAGLESCAADGSGCAPLAEGAVLAPGRVLRTDARTRAELSLSDGTSLSLDRGTRLSLGEGGRRARLESGSIVADVAHQEGDVAVVSVPSGWVRVLGTKFSLSASGTSSAVEVSRGVVELSDQAKRTVSVRAGEAGRIEPGAAPVVGAATELGAALAWSEAARAQDEEPDQGKGLGELVARKPGGEDRVGAVTLASHRVRVRIAGAVARTEVEEVFQNSTDEVLEGVFRFPIPPSAKIDRLALDVDGKLVEGAFVDRDRAAAIWRGAIVHAAPEVRPQIRDEIVWVPGPWRDPALLEWQRGGRFELKIFPIPKRGSRRVVLAYTEVVAPTAGVRRYTYPLAHDPGGTTKVGDFAVDVEVRGHDASYGVRTAGYEVARSELGDASKLDLTEQNFVPAGDLSVEYALPARDAELTAWAYEPEAPAAAPVPGGPAAVPGGAAPALAEADDGSPYAAIALSPRLPRPSAEGPRTLALIVDSSRSMFGEPYQRAARLATRLVRELGESDRVTVLACDATCRTAPPVAGGAAGSQEVARFLGSIVPEGASDPVLSVTAALGTSGAPSAIVYLGDGAPTVGPIRPATVERAVARAVGGRAVVTTVAIGADSDSETLSALARGGGGAMRPFVPGETAGEVAYAVIGALGGSTLSDVQVELPEGLTRVAPRRMDSIAAGSESLVLARMTRPSVEGNVVVRGKIGARDFQQSYPLKLSATRGASNAFVPRLWASARIQDLERESTTEARASAVRLSTEFSVASRHTSLLVLESPAMFRAFGLDNRRSGPDWTGEVAATAQVGQAELADDAPDAPEQAAKEKKADPAKPLSLDPYGSGATAGGVGPSPAPEAEAADRSSAAGMGAPQAWAAPSPTATAAAPASRPAPPRRDGAFGDEGGGWAEERFSRGRRMVPMRRVWERKGAVDVDRTTPKVASLSALSEAERVLASNENSRAQVKKLVGLYQLASDVARATTLAERWAAKEPLDPDALTARADLAASAGDREQAVRILGSVIDVRPSDVKSQQRLARLERWAGHPEAGCRHLVALAELREKDGALLADAVDCARRTGESRLADELLSAADEATRKLAEARIAKLTPPVDELSGDLRVEATWSGGADVDLVLVHPSGHRVSWLGAPTKGLITARDVTSRDREGLALRGAETGEYTVQVVRGSAEGAARGTLVITVAGAKRTVPFELRGASTTVALARISMESRLVPVGPGMWGWE